MTTYVCRIVLPILTPCQCVTDYRYLVGLVSQIVPTFMDSSDVLGKFLGLMLCTIDIPSDVNELESIAHFFVEYFLLVIDHVNVPVC